METTHGLKPISDYPTMELVSGGNVTTRMPFTEFIISFMGRGDQAEKLDVLLAIAASQGVTIHGQYTYEHGRLDASKLRLTGSEPDLILYSKMLLYILQKPDKAFPPDDTEAARAVLNNLEWRLKNPYTHELTIDDMTVEGYEADLMFNLIEASLDRGARARGTLTHTGGRTVLQAYVLEGTADNLSQLDTNARLLLKAYLQRLGTL